METAILVILNVVLLVLAIVAIRLIRSGRPRQPDTQPGVPVHAPSHPETRSHPETQSHAKAGSQPLSIAGGAGANGLDRSNDSASADLASADLASADLASTELASTDSVITVTTAALADAPSRDDLLCGVVHSLGQLGLSPARNSHELGRMATRDGRSALVRVGSGGGSQVVEIAIDSSLAVEAMARLELWKRQVPRGVEHPEIDRVQLRARIR